MYSVSGKCRSITHVVQEQEKKSPYSLIATITLNISRINKTLTTFLPYTVKTPDPMNMKGRVDLDQS